MLGAERASRRPAVQEDRAARQTVTFHLALYLARRLMNSRLECSETFIWQSHRKRNGQRDKRRGVE
jgi:hypothetical protein